MIGEIYSEENKEPLGFVRGCINGLIILLVLSGVFFSGFWFGMTTGKHHAINSFEAAQIEAAKENKRITFINGKVYIVTMKKIGENNVYQYSEK